MNANHESFRPVSDVKRGSDRAFGLVVTTVLTVAGLFPLLDNGTPRLWALTAAAVFGAVVLLAPRLLRPLNSAWFKFGLVLHRIVSPLVLGILFFGAVTPTALIMRVLGKDPLRLRRDPAAQSYWVARDRPGPQPAPATMENQF